MLPEVCNQVYTDFIQGQLEKYLQRPLIRPLAALLSRLCYSETLLKDEPSFNCVLKCLELGVHSIATEDKTTILTALLKGQLISPGVVH